MSLQFTEQDGGWHKVSDGAQTVAHIYKHSWREPKKWRISFNGWITPRLQYAPSLNAAKRKTVAVYVAHKLENAA